MEQEKKRGGSRPNSGRPSTDRKHPLMVRISEESFTKLDKLTDNKSEFIDNLIRQYPL